MSGLPRSPATVENRITISVLAPGWKHRRPGEGADVLGHLERAERAAALGVRLPLRDALPVEVGHLLDQVVVLQQDRAVRADGQRMLVTGYRIAGIVRRRFRLRLGHFPAFFSWWMNPRRRRDYLSPGLRARNVTPAAAPAMTWATGYTHNVGQANMCITAAPRVTAGLNAPPEMPPTATAPATTVKPIASP